MQRTALIHARMALGLTRAELADKIGMDRSVIFRVEEGADDPSLEKMRRWVKALGEGASLDLFAPPKNRKRYVLRASNRKRSRPGWPRGKPRKKPEAQPADSIPAE